MSDTDKLKRKFQQSEVKYLDAVEALQSLFGFSPLDAEAEVERWEAEERQR